MDAVNRPDLLLLSKEAVEQRAREICETSIVNGVLQDHIE